MKPDMKWFKHETDAHSNLKLQDVIDTFGMEGFGYYWVCVELVGMQGEDFRLSGEKNWKNYLKKMASVSIERQEQFLSFFASKNLIDASALASGDLFIPKLAERSDDYTKRVRRVSEPSTNNVHLEQNRTDKNREEQKRIDDLFVHFWGAFPKKVSKSVAKKSWDKLKPSDELVALILSDVNKRADSEAWSKESRKFCPHPATYLNQRRWEDEEVAEEKVLVIKN